MYRLLFNILILITSQSIYNSSAIAPNNATHTHNTFTHHLPFDWNSLPFVPLFGPQQIMCIIRMNMMRLLSLLLLKLQKSYSFRRCRCLSLGFDWTVVSLFGFETKFEFHTHTTRTHWRERRVTFLSASTNTSMAIASLFGLRSFPNRTRSSSYHIKA